MFKNKCIFVTIVMILFLVFCSSIFAQVSVKGYYRKDGTYVKPYVRTSPDRNPYNNYSFPGNYNPNTDKISTGNTETYLKNYYDKPKSTAQVRVKGYYKKDGTYVRSHTRTKPDGNPYNNYSYPGNYNPNTGKITTGNPETYLKNYNKQLNYSTSKIQIHKNEQPVVKIVRKKAKRSTSYTYPTYKSSSIFNTKPIYKSNTNINNIDVPSIPSIKPPPLKVIYLTGSSSSYNNNDSPSRVIDIPINKNNEIINTIPVIEDYFNTNNSINFYIPSIPSSKTYDYSVSGYGDDGYISGDVTVDQDGGDGYIFDDYGNEKYIEVDWTGYGTLEGYDDDGNYYELDVD